MTVREQLLAEAAKRILITDGAFGTEIQNWKLAEAAYAGSLGLSHDQKGNNDILAVTMPEVPETITRAYLDAGSDIVSTNTFSANVISQADYGAEHLVRDINIASAQDRAPSGRRICRQGRPPALRRGGDRADQQDAVAVARRQRSRLIARSISTI